MAKELKWRIVMLAGLAVALAVIFTVGFVWNAQVASEQLKPEAPKSSFDEWLEGVPIEPYHRVAPVTETSVVSEETAEVKVDRSELDAKLEALGYHPSNILHPISLSAGAESDQSLNENH